MDGEFVDWDKANVHILTHTLHYGLGMFEGIRCYKTIKGSAIFRLDEHVDRLFASSHIFNIEIPYSKDNIRQAIIKTVKINKQMLPWPMDRRCVCGGDLSKEFKCCGKTVELDDHEKLLSRHYVLYCPTCGESLAGASCELCGRVYTWKLGTVLSLQREKKPAAKKPEKPKEIRSDPKFGLTEH